MGWIGCVRFEKINCKFFRFTVAKHPSGRVSHEFCRPKTKQRKRTKHEFWVKRVDWVRSFQKINCKFFRFNQWPELPSGRVCTRFVDRNRNCENAPNMSFGSNGVDWVRSFRKINYKFFRFNRGQNCPRGGFARVLSTETETAKTHQT
jgi:hypothetical protein